MGKGDQLNSNAVLAALQAGAAAGMAGDTATAIRQFRRAVQLAPTLPEAHYNLGTALKRAGRLPDALAALREAARLAPGFAPARLNLGTTALALGHLDEAAANLDAAVQLAPKPGTFVAYGQVLLRRKKLAHAAQAFARAAELDPRLDVAWHELGVTQMKRGLMREAIDCFRRALALRPGNDGTHTNLIQALCFHPGTRPDELLASARAFAAAAAPPTPPQRARFSREPRGRIRIGYCSPDIRTHPVGFLWAPVIAAHDRSLFEVFVYDDSPRQDHITQQTRKAVDRWRETRHLSDEQLAEQVRKDRIAVLVDLSGHSGAHRLLTLARRPAPLQGVAGGHFCTTGLSAVDFLVTDPRQSPPGAEECFTERLLRLPDGYVCYRPPAYAPQVSPLPAKASGAVTFGSFNRLAKVTEDAVAVWSRLLANVPSSRLIMAGLGFDDQDTRDRLVSLFAAQGIASDRLRMVGELGHAELLALYHEVDIGLDTFPYSGGLTTCEALWMGVPVVTVAGELFCSRHSLSHLHNVGLERLVAEDWDAYVRIAADLARDLDALAALRAGLRDRVRAAPLSDAAALARAFERQVAELLAEMG